MSIFCRKIPSCKSIILLGTLLITLMSVVDASATTVPMASPSVATVDSSSSNRGNVIVQLAGYVKDSVVRTVNGCGQLWTNHERCNAIRAKQKSHRAKLQKQWEFEGRMTREDMKKRLQSVNGGISYEEYSFLVKGKEDRSKLMNLVFLMWGAPRFLPYALMFSPDMLPSPFAPLPGGSARESGLEKLSRERSYAVIQTLLEMERYSKVVPSIAKLNIFGKKGQERDMDQMEKLTAAAADFLSQHEASGAQGAKLLLKKLDSWIFDVNEISRKDSRLVMVPKQIVKGLSMAVDGPPSPWTSLLPNFIGRSKLVSHIKRISDSDEFLVAEKIDIEMLDTALLVEACNDRLIGGPGRSDEELKKNLEAWLDLAVVQPRDRIHETGEHYNGNVARVGLLCYNSVDCLRDERSSSALPRLLFQRQEPKDEKSRRG